MSLQLIRLLSSALVIGVSAVLLIPADVKAGQYKTLNTDNLAVGATRQATSSPKNSGNAMELEIYEFKTANGGGTYHCNIVANGTGQVLTIRLIGVNGAQISSCAAAAGGGCNTAAGNFPGNRQPLCLVSSPNAVAANSTYTMEVQR